MLECACLVPVELRALSDDLRLSSQFGATCEMLTSARNVLDCAHNTYCTVRELDNSGA
jgi:hypothetical protein